MTNQSRDLPIAKEIPVSKIDYSKFEKLVSDGVVNPDELKRATSRNLSVAEIDENLRIGLPVDFREEQDKEAVSRAEARNNLIAALDEVNPGNRKGWKMSKSDIELIWGSMDGIGNYEYKGLPVELDE